MRTLTHAERATIGAELMAEIYRGRILTEPVNAAGDGNRALSQGLLFRACAGLVEAVEEYLDTGTAKEFTRTLLDMVTQAQRAGLVVMEWSEILEWLDYRVTTATTEEEAR